MSKNTLGFFRWAWLFSRALVYYLLVTVLTLVIGVILHGLFFTPIKVRRGLVWLWGVCAVFLLRVICGVNYRIEGRENLKEGPFVVLCKHQSAWETMMLDSLIHPSCFVFKKQLLRIPFFGTGMLLSQHISVDRTKGSLAFKHMVKQSKDRISKGVSIIIFPEGTRAPVGEMLPFKRGSLGVAKMAGAPVLPVAVNSAICWHRNSFIKYPGTITMVIGKPINPSGLKDEQIGDQVFQWMEQTMKTIEKSSGE